MRRRAVARRRDRSWHQPESGEHRYGVADLAAADGATRLRAAQTLQARLGNAAVQRLIETTHAPADAARREGWFDDEETGGDITDAVDTVADQATAAVQDTQEAVGDVVGQAGSAVADAGAGTPLEAPSLEEPVQLGTGGGGNGSTTFTPASATEDRDEATLNEVATALASKAEAGSTLPTFDPISTDTDGAGRVTKATVTITETVTLPKWTKRDTQCDRHKTEWDRFLAALTAHEQGHVAIDRKAFTDMHKKLIGIKDSDVDAKVAAIQATAETDNETFDTNTGHGTKAGTSIDAGIRCTDKVD